MFHVAFYMHTCLCQCETLCNQMKGKNKKMPQPYYQNWFISDIKRNDVNENL